MKKRIVFSLGLVLIIGLIILSIRLFGLGRREISTPPADLVALAKLIYAKKQGEPVRLEVAAWQRNGTFNVLRQGSVELSPR